MAVAEASLLSAIDVSDALAYSIVTLVGGAFVIAIIQDFLENWKVVLVMLGWLALAVLVGYGIYLLFEHGVLTW